MLLASLGARRALAASPRRPLSSPINPAPPTPAPTASPSMLSPLPGLPQPVPSGQIAAPMERITTLSNGLRVATSGHRHPCATMGLYIDGGAVAELPNELGMSRLLRGMAFRGTKSRSAEQLSEEMDTFGGWVNAVAFRDFFVYSADGISTHTDTLVGALGDELRDALLRDEDVEAERAAIVNELAFYDSQPSLLLNEYLYQVAYADQPFGRAQLAADYPVVDTSQRITGDDVRAFRERTHVASRMILGASGIEHDALVAMAERHLGWLPRGAPLDVERPRYTGGVMRLDGEEEHHATGEPTAHALLAFEGPAAGANMYPVAVLSRLLGGGTSFSSGGPGKGMYSRFYTRVLHRFYAVHACVAFVNWHARAGLVGVQLQSRPDMMQQLVQVVLSELVLLTQSIPQDELSRAKNMLKTSIMYNLEQRAVQADDLSRQLLMEGRFVTAAEHCDRINAVSMADVKAVIESMLSSAPSLVTFAAPKDITLPRWLGQPDIDFSRRVPEPRRRRAGGGLFG